MSESTTAGKTGGHRSFLLHNGMRLGQSVGREAFGLYVLVTGTATESNDRQRGFSVLLPYRDYVSPSVAIGIYSSV